MDWKGNVMDFFFFVVPAHLPGSTEFYCLDLVMQLIQASVRTFASHSHNTLRNLLEREKSKCWIFIPSSLWDKLEWGIALPDTRNCASTVKSWGCTLCLLLWSQMNGVESGKMILEDACQVHTQVNMRSEGGWGAVKWEDTLLSFCWLCWKQPGWLSSRTFLGAKFSVTMLYEKGLLLLGGKERRKKKMWVGCEGLCLCVFFLVFLLLIQVCLGRCWVGGNLW